MESKKNYLSWKEENIGADASESKISEMYSRGFVFTRIGKGIMQQTRAVRIDLKRFELSSENRRILKKIEDHKSDNNLVTLAKAPEPEKETKETFLSFPLPLAPAEYHWSMAKTAKDFYENKFGPGIMSAAKIKEMLTDATKSNFNALLVFSCGETVKSYGICYRNKDILHYSYPFYDLDTSPKDMGLGMMIQAIVKAKESELKYAYLGSLQRPGDTYKLQFKGLEWFDGGPDGSQTWLTDIEKVKTILK